MADIACVLCKEFKVPAPLDHVGEALLAAHIRECKAAGESPFDALIPNEWRQAGDDFAAELAATGCTMEQIMHYCQGAGAFGSYLDMRGWKLVPPGE